VGTRWQPANKSHLGAGTHWLRTKKTREKQQECQAQGLEVVSPRLARCEQWEQRASFHNRAHRRDHENREWRFVYAVFHLFPPSRRIAQPIRKGIGGVVFILYDT
jgi:hypothetical protein